MFCSQCGTNVPEEAGFCPECGAPVTPEEEKVEAFAAPVVPAATVPFEPTAPAAAPTVPFEPAAPTPSPTASFQPPQSPSFNPPNAYAVAPVPSPAPQKQKKQKKQKTQKKSKKKLFIIIGAVVLVILIAVGSIVGYNIYRSSTYDSATEAYNSGDYQLAYDTFTKLGDYEDSASMAALAQKNIDYNEALALFDAEDYGKAKDAFVALGSFKDSEDMVVNCQRNLDYKMGLAYFESGDFDAARMTFVDLASVGFKDADEWVTKTDYALADILFTDGDLYGAYSAFKALGSYEDSADRMKACTTAYPDTGEIYHNDGYVSSAATLVLNCGNVSAPNFFKVYTGDTLVSSFFVNGGGTHSITLPAGNYTIKQASGSDWFGPDIMFGDEGWYEIMTFGAGSTTFDLENNVTATITLAIGDDYTGERVGADSTDRDKF